MSSYVDSSESLDTLRGWQSIGRYLGVCARTVMRLEQNGGFPACRLADGRVFTTKALIDKWVIVRGQMQKSAREAVKVDKVVDAQVGNGVAQGKDQPTINQ